MTFERNKFKTYHNTLFYDLNGQLITVAQFKSSRAPVTKAKFMKVLVKNYTVEDYLNKLQTAAPLRILMNDGLLVHTDGKIILDGTVING